MKILKRFMMATGSNAPDSWEAIDDQSSGVSTDLAKLNVNAKPFVPNVNAPAFVPSFMKTQQLQNPGILADFCLMAYIEFHK